MSPSNQALSIPTRIDYAALSRRIVLAIPGMGLDSRAMPAASLLELNGLSRRHGDQIALDGVSLTVAKGSFVALVGPSGSGKTTLLKTINRLVTPDAGTISLDGRDIAGLPLPELRRQIGYAIQGVGLFPHMTIGENIAIVPRLNGARREEQDARVVELLELTGLSPDHANRYPRQLSGGEAQRVGLARALAARPALMLLDEPFGALDPVTRDALGQAYRDLHDRLGLTTLMVTHDMTEALLIADRIIVLSSGAVRADCTPTALMRGHPDPVVADLISVPRRQAERLAALEAGR